MRKGFGSVLLATFFCATSAQAFQNSRMFALPTDPGDTVRLKKALAHDPTAEIAELNIDGASKIIGCKAHMMSDPSKDAPEMCREFPVGRDISEAESSNGVVYAFSSMDSGLLQGASDDETNPDVATPAKLISGSISEADYPPAARRAGQQGRVTVTYVIDTHGTPTGCTIKKSSGSQLLDDKTCEIIESRFRYRPALNAKRQPVSDTRTQGVTWKLDDQATLIDSSVPEKMAKIDLLIDEGGRVVRCTVIEKIGLEEDPCGPVPLGTQIAQPMMRNGAAVRFHVITTQGYQIEQDGDKP